jgi:hypothetical protein
VLKLGNNNIAGIVMEKANGTNVVKSLKRDGFCNVSCCDVANSVGLYV